MILRTGVSFMETFGRASECYSYPQTVVYLYNCLLNVMICSVLIPNGPSQEANQLSVIDWEFAQLGHRSIDVGGMLADLYERKHFRDVDAAIEAMKGFIGGYGRISDDMAFRTCIHAGVHLICWHIRRNPSLPLPAPLDKVISALTIGRDLILKGWEKDKVWLESSMLEPLFTLA